jgi:hypothetical protein
MNGLFLRAIGFVVTLLSCIVLPQPADAQQRDKQIYQTDSLGNLKSKAPSWTVQSDGRVIETNRYGEKMYHKQQYKIVGDRMTPVDSIGNPTASSPSWTKQPDGRVIETNRYGEKMYHKQQYKVTGDKVMPVDSVGNPQPHKGTLTVR